MGLANDHLPKEDKRLVVVHGVAQAAAHIAVVAFEGQVFGHAGAADHAHTVIDSLYGIVGGCILGGNDRGAEFNPLRRVAFPQLAA